MKEERFYNQSSRLLQITSSDVLLSPVFLTTPTVFSYTVDIMQSLTINLGPYTPGAHLHDSLVSFASMTGSIITLSPTLLSHVGTWTISVTVCDLPHTTDYTFSIYVDDPFPYFSPALSNKISSV